MPVMKSVNCWKLEFLERFNFRLDFLRRVESMIILGTIIGTGW